MSETSPTQATEQAVSTIRELIQKHSLTSSDIAVLVSDEMAVAAMKAKLLTAKVKVTDAMNREPGSIVVETIARFKGLESLAVVIVADRLSANSVELSYVAVSRARAFLVVIGPLAGTQLGAAVADRMTN